MPSSFQISTNFTVIHGNFVRFVKKIIAVISYQNLKLNIRISFRIIDLVSVHNWLTMLYLAWLKLPQQIVWC